MDKNCNTCRLGTFERCKTLTENKEYIKLSKENEGEGFSNVLLRTHKFKENFICDDYKCKFIEYPIEVSKINYPENKINNKDIGRLVKITPCNKKYERKTFLGIYLGRLPIGINISHNEVSKELNLNYHDNPAVLVPEIKEIIFGIESYWGFIESEEDFKEITKEDIENVWYIKMLKGIKDTENKEGDKE